MTEKTIEIEADSLEEAMEQLRSQVPEGLLLHSEKIILDGKPQILKIYGNSMEEARGKAESLTPKKAILLDKREVAPERRIITVEAANETEARLCAKQAAIDQFGSDFSVLGVPKLITTGRKGFAGIGRVPNKYEIEVSQLPATEITYRTRAKVSAKLVDSKTLEQVIVALCAGLREAVGGALSAGQRALQGALAAAPQFGAAVDASSLDFSGFDAATAGARLSWRQVEAKLIGLGPAAVPCLMKQMRDNDIWLGGSSVIADVLAKMGRPALELMAAAYRESPKGQFRSNLADAMVKGCDAESMPVGELLLWDESFFVREKAAKALEAAGWKPVDDEQRALYAVACEQWSEAAKFGAVSVKPLLNAVPDENGVFADKIESGIRTALASLKDPEAVPLLIAALELPRAKVRAVAAEVMGKTGDARVIEPLAAALQRESDHYVNIFIIRALAEIGDARAVELLTAARDSVLDDSVRSDIVYALKRLQHHES